MTTLEAAEVVDGMIKKLDDLKEFLSTGGYSALHDGLWGARDQIARRAGEEAINEYLHLTAGADRELRREAKDQA